MLYLLGGPSRAGKTTVAQRLLAERRVPYFVTEYLVSGLEGGAPALGVAHDLPDRERAERLWPILLPLLRNIVEVEPAYLVEGDLLLPGHAAALAREYPGAVRACFLGYAGLAAEQKLRDVRAHAGGVNDWVQGESDDYVRELVRGGIAYSAFLEAACRRHGLPYVETAPDFGAALERAFACLTAPEAA